MSRSVCLSLSVRGALRWKRRELKQALKWITHDGKPFRSIEELRKAFEDLLAAGQEMIPYGVCDNFDPKEGCRGHETGETT